VEEKLMRIAILLLLSALTLRAATFTLSCDPNPAGDGVTGYNFYERLNAVWVKVDSKATNVAQFTNVTAGIHTYTMTATNIMGESGFGQAVTITNLMAAPGVPTNVTIKVGAVLQRSPAITGPFTNYLTLGVPPFDPLTGYYRVVMNIAQTAPAGLGLPGKMFVIPNAPPLPK
jgi:hypothetical protein